jgi:hypothetical protein
MLALRKQYGKRNPYYLHNLAKLWSEHLNEILMSGLPEAPNPSISDGFEE